ncbi:MAG: DNA translocase FtsK [Desulfovibrio sp.]|nr:DNA translocase FtsK [Desulfovibrio sp.]
MFDGSREGSAGFGREVFGLFLLFWTLLILLSLFTYDPADPSLNHAVSGDPAIVNKAGLFGAYTAGLLNDIFGSASFFLPLALGGVGVSFISRGFHITWIRWIGFTLLSLCLLAVCASWDIPVGDLRGGGVAGWGLTHYLTLFLSPFGSTLLWILAFLVGMQMCFGLSWKKVCQEAGNRCSSMAADYAKHHPASGKKGASAPSAGDSDLEADEDMDRRYEGRSRPFALVRQTGLAALSLMSRAASALGNIRSAREPMPDVDTAPSDQAPAAGKKAARRPGRKGLRIDDEDIPFAADDGGVPMDRSFAEEYAKLHPESAFSPGDGEDEEAGAAPAKAAVRLSAEPAPAPIPEPEPDPEPEAEPEEDMQPVLQPAPAAEPEPVSFPKTEPEPRSLFEAAGVEPPAKKPEPAKQQAKPKRYKFPPLELLRQPQPSAAANTEDIAERGQALMGCLRDFNIQAELVHATPGPVVTTYMVRPARGVSVRVFNRHADDIARSLMAVSVFVQAPVPGTDTVGIVIPNHNREIVNFREIASTETFREASRKMALPLIVGKDTTGRPYIADLAKMPHLLVAGATGQGKSVCLNAMLTSLLLEKTPDELKLLLVDPKRVEMGMYEDESHLVHPVVKEVQDAKNALNWAVHEMDERYTRMSRLNTKNITGYNQRLASLQGKLPPDLEDLEPMPYIAIVIDELADLMLQCRKDVEPCIIRLAQLARACGIHMIIATQRPSVDVVTGLIKANFPCRICFRVSSRQDSMTTLGTSGAEKLLGNGDMFYNPNGGQLTRLHGPFLRDEEVQAVVDYWKKQAKPEYGVDFSTWGMDEAGDGSLSGSGRQIDDSDPLYREILSFIQEQGHVSTSLLQRRFNIGFNKAARYMDQLDRDGLVGPAPGAGKPRPVIMH